MAVHLFGTVCQHVIDPSRPVVRKAIGGPMANWDLICQGGLDWFMYRWYMARNLLTAFALICCVVSLVLAIK
jgi:1,4-dihydroxy-2-naphthoate octaprenyltransferase